MHYTKLIERFWKLDALNSVGNSEAKLYLYLLESWRTLGWIQPFGHSDRFLADRLGMSVNTVRAAKVRLRDTFSLISFSTPAKASRSMEGQTIFYITVSEIDTVPENATVSEIDTVKRATVSKFETVRAQTVSKIDTNNSIILYSYFINKVAPAKAAAGSAVSKTDTVKKRKKIEKPAGAPSLFTQLMDIYSDWYKERNEGAVPKIDGAGGTALKSIAAHLVRQVKAKNEHNQKNNPEAYIADFTTQLAEERAVDTWRHLLGNWDLLRPFLAGRTRLIDINSELQNIIDGIKKSLLAGANGNTGSAKENSAANNGRPPGGKGGSTAHLQSYKQGGADDNPQ